MHQKPGAKPGGAPATTSSKGYSRPHSAGGTAAAPAAAPAAGSAATSAGAVGQPQPATLWVDLRVPLPDTAFGHIATTVSAICSAGFTTIGLDRAVEAPISDRDMCKIQPVSFNKPKNLLALQAVRLDPESGGPGVVQLKRITITIADVGEAQCLHPTNPVIGSYDLVAVCPGTVEVLQKACASGCVDLISFPMADRLPFKLAAAHVKLAVKAGIKFELCYAAALTSSATRRAMLSNAMHILEVAGAKNCIFSSGVFSANEVRDPHDVINLSMLLGVPQEIALKMISSSCRDVVRHAEARKSVHGVKFVGTVDAAHLARWLPPVASSAGAAGAGTAVPVTPSRGRIGSSDEEGLDDGRDASDDAAADVDME